MPRLARKNIKVFAGSATNNGVFGSLQANNPTITSDVEQLQSLSAWGEGWNAATETSEELPPLEEIQGVEYVTTYQQAYIMQEGVPEWAATVTYYKGSLAKEVTSTGFRIYNSLTDNNIGNLVSDTSNWKKVMDSDDLYAFDSTVVHDTGNETIGGNKTFSGLVAFNTYTTFWNTPYNIVVRSTSIEDGVTPSSNQYMGIDFRDKNDVRVAWIGLATKTDGTQLIELQKQGSTSGFATPTPPTGDNSNQIATTAYVKNVLSALYPVGSIYIGTQNSCPLASLISGSQWQLVAQDRALWGGNGSNANTTIAAGLPNITGQVVYGNRGDIGVNAQYVSGAFYADTGTNLTSASSGGQTNNYPLLFNASRSSPIYGNSTTVQPPAYVVNVWRRIA